MGELKAAQAEYKGIVDEATMVVFHGMDLNFILQAVVKPKESFKQGNEIINLPESFSHTPTTST